MRWLIILSWIVLEHCGSAHRQTAYLNMIIKLSSGPIFMIRTIKIPSHRLRVVQRVLGESDRQQPEQSINYK